MLIDLRVYISVANALLNNSQELDNYKHVREEMQESEFMRTATCTCSSSCAECACLYTGDWFVVNYIYTCICTA